MNTGALVLSSLGGIVAFVGGVIVLARAVVRAIGAFKENTKEIQALSRKFTETMALVSQHTIDLEILKDRIRR